MDMASGHTDPVATPASPRLPATERLRRAGIAAWSLIGILVLIYIAFQLLVRISIIFPPLVLAFLVIYTLNPIVTRLEKRGVPRLLGAIGAYVVLLGGLALVIILSIPFISHQVQQLSDRWPEYRGELVVFVEDTSNSLEDSVGIALPADRIECLLGADETNVDDAPSLARCDEVTEKLREAIVAQTDRLTEIGSSVLEVLLIFVLAPLLALYLLVDLPHLQRDALNLVPASHQDEFSDLAGKVGRAVGGFFRGQFLVALTVGLMSALGFALIGLPFWFLIGAIAGFFNLIPLVGPYIGGAIGFLVGTVTGGVGLGLKAALVELIVQQIDNHIISPERDEEDRADPSRDGDACDLGGRRGRGVLGRSPGRSRRCGRQVASRTRLGDPGSRRRHLSRGTTGDSPPDRHEGSGGRGHPRGEARGGTRGHGQVPSRSALPLGLALRPVLE